MYKYTIMLFEFTNASIMCQKIINNILRQYLNRFVVIYLNDIMIYLNTLKEYVNYIFKILKCLNRRNSHLKLEKCEFH